MSRTRVALLVAVVLLAMPVLAAGAELTPPVGGAISDPLTGGFSILSELLARPVTLSWVESLPASKRVGQEFAFSVKAENATEEVGGQGFDNVLFVIEVKITPPGGGETRTATTADLTVTGTGGQALGYESGYFYWGPSDGFPMPAGYEATTIFTATAHTAGNYTFVAWCVDLNAPQN